MVESANEWLAWMGWEASPVNAPQSLAALLTSVRSQAIAEAAKVADREAEYWSHCLEGGGPHEYREQITQRWSVVVKVAASIRSLR